MLGQLLLQTMTDNWQARREFIELDPEHQKLNAAYLDLCRQVHSNENDLRSGTFALQRLLIARDCVSHFADEVDCTSTAEDEQLQAWTANHGEIWAGMYRQAMDEITESALDLCGALTAQREKREAIKAERDTARQTLACYAEKLGRDYDAQQAAKVDD